jgi:hypothetical protein
MGWWGKEWADVAHAGKGRGESVLGLGREGGRGKGAQGRKGEWAGLPGFIPSPFLSPLLNLFKRNHLNSNTFEFKTNTPHTNKIMLQHECTSKLILQ